MRRAFGLPVYTPAFLATALTRINTFSPGASHTFPGFWLSRIIKPRPPGTRGRFRPTNFRAAAKLPPVRRSASSTVSTVSTFLSGPIEFIAIHHSRTSENVSFAIVVRSAKRGLFVCPKVAVFVISVLGIFKYNPWQNE